MYCAVVLFVHTMSQVQICACTRICIWRMYIIELLSEMVYKIYKTGGRQSAGSVRNEAAKVTSEKRAQKKHLHDGIGAFVCLKFCTSARKIKPFR